MAENKLPPTLTDRTRAAQAAREARLVEALRSNLAKRKTQTRARAEPLEPPEPADPPQVSRIRPA